MRIIADRCAGSIIAGPERIRAAASPARPATTPPAPSSATGAGDPDGQRHRGRLLARDRGPRLLEQVLRSAVQACGHGPPPPPPPPPPPAPDARRPPPSA